MFGIIKLPPSTTRVLAGWLSTFLLGLSFSTVANTTSQLSPSALELKIESLGIMTLTSYRSVKSQTDSSPFYTSIGVHTNPYIVAVSQDLLKIGRVKYGDVIYIDGFGFKHVADCMNRRHINSVDLWVATKKEEKRIGVRKVAVWLVHQEGHKP